MNQPLAYIHPQAKIAHNVVIEPFVTIDKNVVVQEGTWIGSNVTINEGARIGKNCKVYPGAVISAIPQDLKYEGEETIAEIGDNTIIREFVTISRGTVDRHKTIIGKNCLIMAYAHVAHDCVIMDNCILANAAAVNIKTETFHIGTIKKFATGKGNADKDLMLAAAAANYQDQNIADDNQADALHILHLYLSNINK